MGRAFGLFLLVIGLGLAAYGLPASETQWPDKTTSQLDGVSARSHTTPPAPAAPLITSPSHGTWTPPSSTAAVLSKAVVQSQALSPPSTLAPMDKLRAAGLAARGVASAEGTATYVPQSATLDAIPRPLEVTSGRATVTAPAVVTHARREASSTAEQATQSQTTQSQTTQSANSVHGANSVAGGWKTTVSTPPEQLGPAAAKDIMSGTLEASVKEGQPAFTRTAKIALTTPAGAADPTFSATTRLRVDQADSAKVAAAKERAEVKERAEAKVDKERAAERTRVAQRPTPPVYLGKTSSSSSANSSGNDAPPRRANFKAQDMWERNRRDGT